MTIKNKIAFINLPGNVFLPFLGVVLQDIYQKQAIRTDRMMPATQMVFLELLYQAENAYFLKGEVANRLSLAKTSITRATMQLADMGLIMQQKLGTEIRIKRNLPRKEYYEKAKKYLINPVQKMIEVKWEPKIIHIYKAGESALSEYSSLNGPKTEEMAVYKGDKLIDQLERVDLRFEDEYRCVKLQLWKYDPTYFVRDGKVDPISLVCSLKDNYDERIAMCTEEILGELKGK